MFNLDSINKIEHMFTFILLINNILNESDLESSD